MPFAKNGVFWLAYVFGVIAIAAQIYVYPKAFEGESARSKFYGFPIAKLSTIYLIVQLILSILCMAISKVLPTWVPVVFIVLLAAAVDTLQQALVDGDIPAALQQVKQCEIALAERNRLCKVSKHG